MLKIVMPRFHSSNRSYEKKQEDAILSDVPRDLILEAKIRIGDDKKAAASILALECSPADEERRSQILHVEKNIGQMLSDVDLGAVSRATNGETFDALKTHQAVHKADTWSRLWFQKKKHRPVMGPPSPFSALQRSKAPR